MDFRKISLWLFLLISSIYNSECKSLKKYQIPNNGGMDADEHCFCFKSPGNHQKVPEILSPNENSLERLVVYLYKDKLTNQVKLYIPNKEKQGHVPDLAFEVGDRLVTVGEERVKNIFDLNARNVNIVPNTGLDVKPINEASTEIKKPDDYELEDPVNNQPHISPYNSGELDDSNQNNKQYPKNVPRNPSSLEHGLFPISEEPSTNLDFDKSPYHMYDVPGAVPNYYEFYHEQHDKPNNNIIKIISQEINIPNKIIYDDVYREPQSDHPNHDLIYDPIHDASDQVISHEIKDPDSSIYDPMLVHNVSDQAKSHEMEDPDSSIYGHLDPNVVHVPEPNNIMYDNEYTEANNERPYYINTDTPYDSLENIPPSKTTDVDVVDKPGVSDFDSPDFVDIDAEMDRPKSQERDQQQETENSSSVPNQLPIEESAKTKPAENSSSAPSHLPSAESVKSESTEDIKSIEEPNSSTEQSNRNPNEEIIENESKEEPSSVEVDNIVSKKNMTCNENKCTADKSITEDNIGTESQSNEENNEPVENSSIGDDISADEVNDNNSKENEHEIKINDNHYETFDRWFIQQMDRFRTYTEHDRAVNLLTIERYILKILHDNGMFVTSEGVLTDSFGTALDVNNMHLRPILIGNTMAFGSILNAKGTNLVMPANMAYLQAILVTNANPSMILGIIPIGKTVIPPSAINAFSTILTPHVHNNDPVTHHSIISNKYPKHYFETTKVNIEHVPSYTKRKPIVLHLTKHVPSAVRTLGKKKGKTVITVVKKRPIIVQSHHRLRQPPKVHVYGVGSGESKFLTGDSADAVKKLISALREGNDPMKSAEATNKLLASLRKSSKSLDLTPENSNESDSDYADDDIAGRIVGGSAATGSGAPLSVKGRIKDF